MQSINDVMRGHGELRTKRFSGSVKEIAGELTPKELLTFVNRISPYGTVSYSTRRFETFPPALPLPFVLRVRQATAPRPAPAAVPPPAGTPQPSGAPSRPAPQAEGAPANPATP